MAPEAPGKLPEGMCTVKLAAQMVVRGVPFEGGSVVPCFSSSQLTLLKHSDRAPYHLLSGLYAWLCEAGREEPGYAQTAARLATAAFPVPPSDGAPPLPLASVRAGGMVLCLLEGNVAGATTEVIVNAANDQMQMGGGVAGALRSRGGIELEMESKSHAPAKMGDIVRTSAGKLAARELYHAVVIEYTHMNRTELADVESSFQKALETALDEGVSSIAVPMLGCGVGGLSVAEVAAAYLSVARQVGARRKRGLLVVLMAYGEEDAALAAQALRDNADPSAAAREAEEFLREAQRLLGYKGDT